jgi:hypothetical protein
MDASPCGGVTVKKLYTAEAEIPTELKLSEFPKLKYAPLKNVDVDEYFSLHKLVQSQKKHKYESENILRVSVIYGEANCEEKV